MTNQLKYYGDPSSKGGGGEGVATYRVQLRTEYCQSFFINAASKLVNKLQAACD